MNTPNKEEALKKTKDEKKCADVMTKDPVCCRPADTAARAAQLMRESDVGPIPVVENEETKRLVGIVTDRDLALKVVAEGRDPNAVKVDEVMTREPVTCRAEDELQKAVGLMAERQLRRIPVVDEGGRIVGIIAQADVATRTDAPEKTAGVVEEISKPRGDAGEGSRQRTATA